ncbi:fimbria/pilus outer membrane usher protein [Paraburkholderia sp. BCC1885]|uniref:fimbria/pilus outer membrane usher protein n=1 Tax=Paraburkholderia sp. BCC1885 TaxID=2562669 RepID=UPI001182F2A9|nr:fimbria/pilus outer membrane usher protein [Paraburkholderia sp. BCC1885]
MQSKNHAFPLSFRLRPLGSVALLLVTGTNALAAGASGATQTAQVEFNDLFLQRPGEAPVDVSRFEKGNLAAPGEYRADLYVNQGWLGRAEITLKQVGSDVNNVQPCFNRALLERIGVDLSKLSVQATDQITQAGACVPLPDLVPDAIASFDNGEQRVDISVPQASMNRQARGYVDPRYWDEGVPAALLQYNANVYQAQAQGVSSTQGYVGLTAGLNLGPWRFRHNGNLTSGTDAGTHYQDVQTELQRSIVPLKSQLTIGDGFTDGTVFDSYGFRGVQLATDDMMYPESQRGYAPTIHGIANSNALVQVSQNGNIIYETNVAPGPFVINDLYPTGYGGNLTVTVTEADGSKHVSQVPYAPAVNALRPGITRYSLTAGQYRDQLVHAHPMLFQGTVQHGFTNAITGYAGFVAADGYVAELLGSALTTDFGAFALDITQANTNLPNASSRSGQSLRLAYSKLIAPTDTNVTVAAYRYSSSGYLGLADAMRLRDVSSRGLNEFMINNVQRSQLQITVNQTLPSGWGSFYLSGSTQDYWNATGRTTQFQAGYNNNFKRINYGISAARQQDLTTAKWDNTVMLTVSVPLGNAVHSPYSSTSLQHDSRGATTAQESLTGSLGVDNAFTYGLNVSNSGGGAGGSVTSAGGNAAYISPVATITGSASTTNNNAQYGAGLSGGIVAYGGGVAFTPSMGETIAIVEAKDAGGARVANASGLRVDPWGHAIVSNLTPFSDNEVEIDPKGLPISVELKESAQHTAPTAGAVVWLKFETEGGGRSVIMRAKMADGSPVPFGAQVTDASGQEVGTVAQTGRIVIHGLKSDAGSFNVKWGDAGNQQCKLSYALPAAADSKTVTWTVVDSMCGN